jgi:uncharacterized membrane protein YeaQ/YmgE (transglycosylase-associated protein family)
MHPLHILYIVIIGFFAGLIARFIMPGPNNPSGFIMTTILGIVGAVVANYIGKAVGWYHEGQPLGFISAIVGAVIILFVYHLIAGRSDATI